MSTEKGKDDGVLIAVMGPTGAGKSTFISGISGQPLAIGHSLRSQTITIETATFTLEGRSITLVDTPGFDDTTRTDADILRAIAAWLQLIHISHVKLSGIIFMHRISDNRLTGSALKNLNMFRKLCGDDFMPNVALVTTMWGKVVEEEGGRREVELRTEYFKELLQKGASMSRYDNTKTSAKSIISGLAVKRPAVLKIQRELVDSNTALAQTEAGMVVNEEITRLEAKHLEEMTQIQEVQTQAIAAKDKILQEFANRENERLQKVLDQERQSRDLLVNVHEREMASLRADLERRLTEVESSNQGGGWMDKIVSIIQPIIQSFLFSRHNFLR